jgi:glycosyltransferase involved in cell wall biosynthesis
MNVAIVHDYLNQYGGAERVLEVLHDIFPDAPVYTLIFDRTRMPAHFQKWDIKESFLRKLPFEKRHYEKYFLLMPLAIESFNLNEYDLVISISSAWSKGVITLPSTVHINYMLNPMRFAWDSFHPLINARSGLSKILLFLALYFVRHWDVITSTRPDLIIGISRTVAKRIQKFYGITPRMIYPPVNTEFFTPNKKVKKEDFFLLVSRLRPYKRVDIAIEAFNKTRLPLLIIGEGSLKGSLRRKAGKNIQFLGKRSDEEVREYYRRAQAVIFPTCEDFGIVPLEASACGTPVIAFKRGGATETVIEGKNGIFFSPQDPEALLKAVLNFHTEDYNPKTVRKIALKFSTKQFVKNFKKTVKEIYEKKKM